MPQRVDFSRFYINHIGVFRKVAAIRLKLAKDNDRILNSECLGVLADGEWERTEYNQQQIYNYSNSTGLGVNLAEAIRFLRTYGLLFINEYDNLDVKARMDIYKKLINVYDFIIFATLEYYGAELQQHVVWDMEEQCFYYYKDLNNVVLKSVISILDADTHLCNAIVKNDKNAAVNVMHNELLHIEDMFAKALSEECDEIFEL